MLRLFIIDDNEIFRAGLTEILRPEKGDFEVSGSGEPSDEVEAFCTAAAPDVLLVHASGREMDKHLQIAGRIKKKVEGTRVLVIAEFTDIDYLLKIAASGCDGYVHSGISGRSLVRIIQNLGNDVYIFDRTVIDKVLLLEDERRVVKRSELSPREQRIVEMLAEGQSNAAIGKELNLSAGTVKNLISDMLKQHRFKNRAQLVKSLFS
ncbi:MAG: response regulator transcription factor [Synergistaceae bacterium]|nr:response regulator transcription factor [Synergistaceae bacterium]